MKHLRTSTGIEIPIIGLGTWQLSGLNCENAITHALDSGYRHIDTAAMYRNEKAIGKAITSHKIKRQDLFLTSKVWTSELGRTKTEKSFEQTLLNLQTDYLDLFLIHWPGDSVDKRLETYEIMMELRAQDKIRAIGVSNFNPSQIDQIYEKFGEYPAVNQILFNPFNFRIKKLEYCNLNNILLTAYTPLNKGSGLNNTVIQNLSNKYQKTPAQIVLRWFIDMNVITIPKSGSPKHLEENIDIFDFQLEQIDIDSLKNL